MEREDINNHAKTISEYQIYPGKIRRHMVTFTYNKGYTVP